MYNNLSGAKTYLAESTDYSMKYLREYHQTQLVLIHHSALRSLLNEFIERCEKHNIYLELNVIGKIDTLPIPQIDLIRSLSILLNNAFDASLKEDEPYIQLTLKKDKVVWFFQVENFISQTVDIYHILAKKNTKEKGHSGLGIPIIRKIAKKYPMMTFDFQVRSNRFIASLQFIEEK